jgi:hypothetical protein
MQFYHTKISDIKVSAELEAKELKKMYDEKKISREEIIKSINFYSAIIFDVMQHLDFPQVPLPQLRQTGK